MCRDITGELVLNDTRRIVLLSAMVMLSTGCASIVRKPDINKVTKVAVLSVYANETVPEKNGRGTVKDWDNQFRMEVAESALAAAESEVGRLGWQVVSGKDVIQSPDYQDAFRPKASTGNETANQALEGLARLAQHVRNNNFFTPPGMHPIQIGGEKGKYNSCVGNGCAEDPKAKLADLAKKLDVDAVVIVELDYCYQGGTFSLGGTGEAKLTAGSNIRAVSRDGQMIIDMDDIPRCEGKTRSESENSMLMNGGDLIFLSASREKMKAMFTQATVGSLQKSVGQVQSAMK
jgi:hypothetical protein